MISDFISHSTKVINQHTEYVQSLVMCSECHMGNDKNNNYCIYCGHKIKKMDVYDKDYRKFCVYCGNQLERKDRFCGDCGREVKNTEKIKVCPICGEWCGSEKYCWNCGHNNYKFGGIYKIVANKKCPNCNEYYDKYYNYCDFCGTKLVNKNVRI